MKRANLRTQRESVSAEAVGFEHVQLAEASPFRAFMHGCVTIPLHWHPEVEIVAVLAGEVHFVVAGQPCLMRAGDVMIINQNVVHNSAAWADGSVVCGLHIDGEHYDRLGLPGFSRREFLCRSFLHGKHFKRVSDPIRAIIARLIIHQQSIAGEEFLHRFLVDGLCYFIYHNVPWDKHQHELEARSNNGRERILHIMRRVRSDYQKQLSLQSFAEEAGVSLSHLSRNFSSYVGLGFQDYIMNLRLDYALREIRTTGAPISEIINQSGFSNSTLFFSKFRSRFGRTPSECRNGHSGAIGPQQPTPLSDETTMQLLLDNAGQLDAFGGFGTVEAPRAQLRMAAPHGLSFGGSAS